MAKTSEFGKTNACPGLSTHKVVSPPSILPPNATVDILINAKDGT